MSWKHANRRKRGEGKKGVKEFASESVMTIAGELLNNRWRMLTPFPLNPIDLYNAVFSPEQHRAIELLNRTMPSVLNEGSELRFTFDLDAYVVVQGVVPQPQVLTVDMADSRPLPDFGGRYLGGEHKMLLSQLPPALRDPAQEWARAFMTASLETRMTKVALKRLFDVCSTLGQVKRLWPNACNLLPEKAQEVLRNAKVKSPYPAGAFAVRRDEGGNVVEVLPHIDPFWSADNLAWFDDRLTEALCLPMVDGSEGFLTEVEFVT